MYITLSSVFPKSTAVGVVIQDGLEWLACDGYLAPWDHLLLAVLAHDACGYGAGVHVQGIGQVVAQPGGIQSGARNFC